MKREIKFRGKSQRDGEWFFGYLTVGTDGRTHIGTPLRGCLCIDPETIGQYTGIKDKNGVEIYEGDILLYTDGRCGDVQWKGCLAGFHTNDFRMIEREMEVIGNIYDNPRNART